MTWSPGLKTSHRAADSLDNSRGFMAHDDGWETPPRTSIVSVHVASADSASLNANEQVIVTGLWLLHIDEIKLSCIRRERAPSWILLAV